METLKSLMKKSSICSTKRLYDVETVISETAKHSVKVEYIIRDLIFKKLNNVITDQELTDTVMHIYDDDDSIKGHAKVLRSEELLACLNRYFSSEKRIPAEAPESILDIYDVDVDVNPDALFINGEKIEVVKYFNKKPDIGNRTDSLALYSLLYYGKQVGEMMLPGKNVQVTALFYFLKKQNDRQNDLHPEKNNFDLDFFNQAGKNVVSLIDFNLGDVLDERDRVTQLDAYYYNLFQNFKSGQKLMCNALECRYCSMYNMCSYHDAKSPIPAIPKGNTLVTFTDEQKKVIDFKKGLARVNAGAGTGKTMTIAGMVAKYLQDGVKPEQIVVSTFTNASAKEMQERIKLFCKMQGIEADTEKVVATTFNALGDIYLRENYTMCGYLHEPELIEDSQINEIIEELILDHPVNGLNYRYLRANETYVKGGICIAKDVFKVFKTYKILALELDKKMDFIMKKLSNDADYLNESIIRELYPVYVSYQKKLIDENLMDYTDQEMAFSKIDNMNPDFFKHTGYKKIIIDEFQDSNESQLNIIKILMKSNEFESLVVVGDDSQSIYGFRDATPYNIINFDQIMGQKITDFYLTKNFRSTPQIIDLANKVNELNTSRIKKNLVSEKPNGPAVLCQAYKDTKNEYKDIVEKIKAMLNGGVRKPEDIAFIARNKSELIKFQELLDAEGIDSTILVPELLKENSRIIAVIGLFQFLTTEGDEAGAATYINSCLNGEWFNITSKERTDMLKEHLSYAAAFRDMTPEDKYEAFNLMVDRIPGIVEDELFGSFVENLKKRHTWSAVASYLIAFNTYGDQNSMSKKEKYSGITLTTAHSSKGLEWPVVFNSITKYDKAEYHEKENLAALEEERRLLFVSITRAKEELYLSGKYYSFGTFATAVSKKNPGSNINLFMKDLYNILGKGDIVAALKLANK